MKNLSLILVVFLTILVSCASDNQNPRDLVIDDLPFNTAKDAKTYSDLVFKAIRTNRTKAIAQEFQINGIDIDEDRLTTLVSMYSSGIGGRDDWQFYDFHAMSEEEKSVDGFDYAWLDPSDRLGIQIFIVVNRKAEKYFLERLEFRSRLDVMDSWAFPGGEIDDYKKIEYDWSL